MKIWFTLLMGLLIITNFMAVYYLDPLTDRWFRFGASLIILLFFIFRSFSNYRLLSVFLLFAICDGLLVYYEEPFLKRIIYGVRILAYLNLIIYIIPFLSKLKFHLLSIVVGAFIILIDLYLLHEMATALPIADQTPLFLILFYSLGIISLVLVAVSLSYLNRFSNLKAFFMVVASMAFILSDISFYNAYYLGFSEFNYLDRFVNIIGMGALLLFSWQKATSPKIIESPLDL